jgi:tRNA(Ile)-lysidine synthase
MAKKIKKEENDSKKVKKTIKSITIRKTDAEAVEAVPVIEKITRIKKSVKKTDAEAVEAVPVIEKITRTKKSVKKADAEAVEAVPVIKKITRTKKSVKKTDAEAVEAVPVIEKITRTKKSVKKADAKAVEAVPVIKKITRTKKSVKKADVEAVEAVKIVEPIVKISQQSEEKEEKINVPQTKKAQPQEQVQEASKPMSKGARRRAKKKAKKLKNMVLAQEQNQTNAIQPVQQNTSKKNKQQDNKNQNQNAQHNKLKKNNNEKNDNKKHQNKSNEVRLEPLAMLEKRTEKKQENIDDNTSLTCSDNYRKQKPIPWVDLSKLENDIQKMVINTSEDIVSIESTMLLTLQQRRDAFFQNFYREVEKFVISEMLVEKGSKLVVAVSGGVDSVVLLDVLVNLADMYKFQISVVHYNHNLRGDASNKDEKFVRELSAKYNIPFYSANGKVTQYAEKNSMSIEEAARFLRYFFFERITRTIGSNFLATAHTSDDSAETFLLNLFRGAGLTGLSGIPAKRQFVKDVIIIRPFLKFSKQSLIEYANKRGLEWREDESNLQKKYTRNKIRLDLIPKLKKDYSPSIIDIINRAAKLIQDADRIIHNYVKTHLSQILFDISTESISIKLPLFKTFDEFIRGEMLQTILMKYFRIAPPNMKIIDRILKLESSDIGAICEITKNIFVVKDRQAIVITKKNLLNVVNQKIQKKGKFPIGDLIFILTEINPEDVEYSNNNKIEFIDFNLISNELTVRNWEHSDEFNPLGMLGTMSVSDFLMNEKVPFLNKPNVLVLTDKDNEIIWVCGYRISNKYKITTKTQKVLKIEIKEKGKV